MQSNSLVGNGVWVGNGVPMVSRQCPCSKIGHPKVGVGLIFVALDVSIARSESTFHLLVFPFWYPFVVVATQSVVTYFWVPKGQLRFSSFSDFETSLCPHVAEGELLGLGPRLAVVCLRVAHIWASSSFALRRTQVD